MAIPVRPGHLVLWNSTTSVEQLPALVVSVPLYAWGGVLNDGVGGPLLVDLLSFSMSGQSSQYRVPFSDVYAPGTWSPLAAA